MTDNEIKEDLDDYSEWIDKDIPIHDGWIDEINYISFIRDEIHQSINSETSADIINSLRLLDQKWQKQIELSISKNFKYTDKPQKDYPNAFWWWHIDKLDDLTEQERSTL